MKTVPFNTNFDGSINYQGDRGVHSVQISETMKVDTSMDGGSVLRIMRKMVVKVFSI